MSALRLLGRGRALAPALRGRRARPVGDQRRASASRTRWCSPPGSTRTPRRWPGSSRWASPASRWARSPRGRSRAIPRRGCSASRSTGAHQPDGLQQPRRGGDGGPAAARSAVVPGPVGVNLGKNKDTPLERAVDDYLAGVEALGAARRLPGGQRQLAEHAGAAAAPAAEPLRALLSPVKARLDAVGARQAAVPQDRSGPHARGGRRRRRRGGGGRHRRAHLHQHHPRPPRSRRGRWRRRPAGSPARRSRPLALATLRRAADPRPGAARALGLGRRLHRRRRAGAARGRRRPGPGVHRRSSTRGRSSSRLLAAPLRGWSPGPRRPSRAARRRGRASRAALGLMLGTPSGDGGPSAGRSAAGSGSPRDPSSSRAGSPTRAETPSGASVEDSRS